MPKDWPCQTVSVSSWQSYNVDPKDTASYQQHNRQLTLMLIESNPMLVSHEFDGATGILTLTYNKEV